MAKIFHQGKNLFRLIFLEYYIVRNCVLIEPYRILQLFIRQSSTMARTDVRVPLIIGSPLKIFASVAM